MKEYCSSLTKEDCRRQSGSFIACEKVGVVSSYLSVFKHNIFIIFLCSQFNVYYFTHTYVSDSNTH